jgi:hypothetical protein
MSLRRNAVRLGLIVLAVIAANLLLQLVRQAEAAYAAQRQARAAAPPPTAAAWMQTFHFDHATAPQALLGAGWSTIEPGSGVWTNAPQAVLHLPPAPLAGPADVALEVDAFVAPKRPFQRMRARVGDRVLGEWRLTSAKTTTLRFALPAELRSGGDVQLDLPDAASPLQVNGAMDSRRLAIKLHRVDIVG